MRRASWIRLLLLLAVILVAFVLRMYLLDHVSLRGDESFTVLFVLKPFAEMWHEILTVEPNPPLLYLLLRGWVAIAGAGEFATRYFSVFWGVLCVALLYRFTCEFFKLSSAPRTRIALAAALLIAINPYQIWHSQDVRNYTMWPALSLLALVFFWQWRNRIKADGHVPLTQSSVIPFVLAELAALYTHYYEAFILVALNLYVLFFLIRRWRTFWKSGIFSPQSPVAQWVGAQVALAALYLPFPLLLSDRVSSYGEGSAYQGLSLWDIWQRTFSSFMLGETLDDAIRGLGWIPLAVALVVILLVFVRREQRGLFLLLWGSIPTLALYGLSLSRPLFLERYLNGIAPVYYLLFAYGIGLAVSGWRRVLPLLLAAGLVCLAMLALGNYYYNPAFAKAPDWRGLARAIQNGRQAGDIIVQNFPENSLLYYEGGHLPLVRYPEEFMPGPGTVPALNNLNYKYKRIWFIPAAPDIWDPDHFVQAFLDKHDDRLSQQDFGNLHLTLYSTPIDFAKTMRPSGAQVGKFFTLSGYRLAQQETGWRLVLYWRTSETTNKNYNVFVYEVGSGTDQQPPLLDKIERPPLDGVSPTSEWNRGEVIVDSYDLPTNSALTKILVGMYDPATSNPLQVTDKNGVAADYIQITP